MLNIKTKTCDAPNAAHLAYLAVMVAVEAPVRANKYSSTAKISWELIDRLRAALDEVGFDWRTAATREKIARAAEYAERIHARYAK